MWFYRLNIDQPIKSSVWHQNRHRRGVGNESHGIFKTTSNQLTLIN